MRLDPALSTAPVRPAGEPARTDSARRAADFEALLKHRGAGDRFSLQRDLQQLGEVGSLDPSLFSGSRALELLEHAREHLLPALQADPQTLALADAVIAQEIEWRQLLDGYRQEELA
ncbi:hypothetical protein [Stutzerimonas chloritidismutans]|uniref:hypothetical protein n=1 Tax=Stutzerimonas chloritidismutans TaxID=203192 RepID=UPI003F14700F